MSHSSTKPNPLPQLDPPDIIWYRPVVLGDGLYPYGERVEDLVSTGGPERLATGRGEVMVGEYRLVACKRVSLKPQEVTVRDA